MVNSPSLTSDVFQDGRTAFTPAPVGWPMDPLDPPPPANFDATMAELFSFPPFAGDVHTTYMPDNSGILDPASFLDLPPPMPFDQLAATSFQSSQSSASPMTCFATSGLQDVSNKNSLNFAANGRDTSSTRKDKRSIGVSVLLSRILLWVLITLGQSIVRAECRRLCGATEYTAVTMRQNSRPARRTKYTLPDPGAMPRRDGSGMLLHNPQWKKPTTNIVNELFIDAVVDAVQLVQVSSATRASNY